MPAPLLAIPIAIGKGLAIAAKVGAKVVVGGAKLAAKVVGKLSQVGGRAITQAKGLFSGLSNTLRPGMSSSLSGRGMNAMRMISQVRSLTQQNPGLMQELRQRIEPAQQQPRQQQPQGNTLGNIGQTLAQTYQGPKTPSPS